MRAMLNNSALPGAEFSCLYQSHSGTKKLLEAFLNHATERRDIPAVLCFLDRRLCRAHDVPQLRQMAKRTCREIVDDHLQLRSENRLDDDLRRNYAEDVVMLTSWGLFKGHEGVRTLAAKLKCDAPDAGFNYDKVLVDGPFGFLRWSAQGETCMITNGADSYVIRGGKIIAQSIHYEVQPKR
jgi:hypothetical protein